MATWLPSNQRLAFSSVLYDSNNNKVVFNLKAPASIGDSYAFSKDNILGIDNSTIPNNLFIKFDGTKWSE